MFSRSDNPNPNPPGSLPKIIINGQEIDLNQYAHMGNAKVIINGQEIDLGQYRAQAGAAQPQIIIDGQPVGANQVGQAVLAQAMRKNRGRTAGCACSSIVVGLIIAIGTFAGIGAAVLAVFNPNALAGFMTSLTGVRGPETRKITGDTSKFDPFAAYGEVSDFAGDNAKLIEISVNYVRADGTMDLTATYSPAPSVDYKFAREVPRPSDAPPVGVAGSTNGPWYEPVTIRAFQPGQRRRTSITKGGVRTTFDWINDGLVRDVSDPTSSLSAEFIPQPKCSITKFWQAAIAKDAPPDAVATIRYNQRGYSFDISGAQVHLQFDMDCKQTR